MRVYLLLAELDERDLIVQFADNAVERVEGALELLAFAHQALRAAAVAPKVRRFGLTIEDR